MYNNTQKAISTCSSVISTTTKAAIRGYNSYHHNIKISAGICDVCALAEGTKESPPS